MKPRFGEIIALSLILSTLGCQAAFRIKPEQFPLSIANEELIEFSAKDGTKLRLSDIYAQNTGTVAIFWQTTCPCVKRYQARINRLYERYQKHKVALMHLSSNTNESFDEVIKEYEKRAIPLPLYRDEGGLFAHATGAKGTPTAVLMDQKGEVVFMGWIDNERDENEQGRTAYLENAIENLLKKHAIEEPTAPMFGCSIR